MTARSSAPIAVGSGDILSVQDSVKPILGVASRWRCWLQTLLSGSCTARPKGHMVLVFQP